MDFVKKYNGVNDSLLLRKWYANCIFLFLFTLIQKNKFFSNRKSNVYFDDWKIRDSVHNTLNMKDKISFRFIQKINFIISFLVADNADHLNFLSSISTVNIHGVIGSMFKLYLKLKDHHWNRPSTRWLQSLRRLKAIMFTVVLYSLWS